MLLFTLSTLLYVIIFNNLVVYVSILALSFIAMVASLLSDKKSIKQFITLLVLSGAKRKTLIISIMTYMSIKVLPITIAYTTYLLIKRVLSLAIITLALYIVVMTLLSEATYRVMGK